MTEAAAVSSVPPVTVTGGEFRDESLPADPLLQTGTYIDAESNVSVETTTPSKGVVPEEERNVPDLTPAPAESAQETQNTPSAVETAPPPRYGSRSMEVSVERPSWLPMDWRFEAKVRTSGATAGTVDRVNISSLALYTHMLLDLTCAAFWTFRLSYPLVNRRNLVLFFIPHGF